MYKYRLSGIAAAALAALSLATGAQAAGPRAEVLHWWTSSSESAAVRKYADAYRAAGASCA